MKPSWLCKGVGRKKVSIAVALGALLTGCAVLTVDVDVYKGALVNEEHVQLHQLVAVATAAKPMLITLRNNHEWPNSSGVPPDDTHGCLDTNKYWYENGYLQELRPDEKNGESEAQKDSKKDGAKEEIKCGEHLRSGVARRVNRILHLYEDLPGPDFSIHAKKLREALDRLRNAKSILEDEAKQNQETYGKIAAGFKPDKDLETSGLTSLRAAYGALLVPGPEEPGTPVRKVGELMDILRALALSEKKSPTSDESKKDEKKAQTTIEDALILQWEGTNKYKEKKDRYERRMPFRVVWKLLSEEAEHPLLTEKTKALFRDDDQGKAAYKKLNERIRELVDAYWNSRQATRELWEESLNLLAQIDRLERQAKEPNRYRALKELTVNLAVTLTNVRQVASALERVGKSNQCSIVQGAVDALGLMCNGSDSDMKAAWTEDSVRNNSERYEAILGRALSTAPAETAYFLLDLDGLEKHATPTGTVGTLINSVNQSTGRRVIRLGLNRTYIDEDNQNNPAHMVRSAAELTRILVGGFERGRLLSGIHTLTEKYLLSHDRRVNEAQDDEDEARLLDALVEFAQKVLFLANHERLVSPSRTKGLFWGVGEYLGRWLFSDKLIDKGYWHNLPEYREQTYVRVLQAVGNTILFSANELRERERYREEGRKKVSAEVTAVQSVYSPNPKKILEDLLNELEREKQAAQRALADAQARKAEIEAHLGSSTTIDRKDNATKALAQAETDLSQYRNSLSTLEAVHAVLTSNVVNQVKTQWIAGQPNPKDEADFLTGAGGFSLESTLNIVRGSHNGTPIPAASQKWTAALNHVASSGAKDAFVDYRKRGNQTSLTRTDLLDQFLLHVRELEATRVKGVAQLEHERDQEKADLGRIVQEIAALSAEVIRLDKRIAELPQKIAALETSKMQIDSVKADVLQEADQSQKFASPNAIYLLVHSHLEKKESSETTADKKKPYQTAQEILLTRTPPPGIPLDRDNYKSPREVMDAVIALLRHRQMEAVERFGKDSAEDKKATEAIENAYRHRAGMIYIRPSSAYLRTSFPSTSLQEDPNLAWDNMLLKQGIRNLPFASEVRDILNPSEKQDRLLTSELDKQYWQNINRVRVSGTGFTNQALVKDDVGNWYVKHYYGNTDDIWKSAKNLGLMSLGAKVPIDLAKKLQNASSSEEYFENAKDTPTLQKVLEKHQDVYTTHTKDTQAKLDRLHTKAEKSELQVSMIAAWDTVDGIKNDSDFRTSLNNALEAEVKEWDKTAAALKEKTNQDPGQAIVKDVQALSKLGTMLSAQLKTLSPSNPSTAEKLKTNAVSAVHRVVGGYVLDILNDRNQALDRYEQAIVFIGDAANPKDAKQSNSDSEVPEYEDIRK